jgi:hypothetical protein
MMIQVDLKNTGHFLERLNSPGFLFSLGLLLLNDFVLKQKCPGMLTGKLSDFAGLFAFGYFWCSLLPERKRQVLASIAIFFVWWKAAWSQPALDFWNTWGWPAVGRTVDPADNVALLILLLVPAAITRSRPVLNSRLGQLAILGLSLFSFLATSKQLTLDYDDQAPNYVFDVSKQDFLAYLEKAGFLESGHGETSKGPWPEQFGVLFTGNEGEYGTARILVAQVGEHTVIWLNELTLGYVLASKSLPSDGDYRPAANRIFESLFVDAVRMGL